MLKDGKINWVETLAQIADDKECSALGAYIRKFEEQPLPPPVYEVPKVDTSAKMPVDYSGLSSNFAKPVYNITVMPEATCDGCQ